MLLLQYSDMRRQRRFSILSPTGLITTAVVAYGTYKLSQWLNGDDEKNEEKEEGTDAQKETLKTSSSLTLRRTIDPRARDLHLEKCIKEINSAHKLFLGQLSSAIESFTSISKETKALKRLRKNKSRQSNTLISQNGAINPNAPHLPLNKKCGVKEFMSTETEYGLWNRIKVKQMTRLMSTMYAHNILYLVLYVQVHILGGRLFRYEDHHTAENLKENVGFDPEKDKMSSHIKVLTESFQPFSNHGVEALVMAVEEVVRATLEAWCVVSEGGLLGSINMDEFLVGVKAIRESFEYSSNDLSSSHAQGLGFARFVIPDDDGEKYKNERDELTTHILDESWDILESPLFRIAEKKSLNESFFILRHAGLADIFETVSSHT